MKAEIITIGDEILIGQIVDTNSAWMAQLLNQHGIFVNQITSLPDDETHLITAIDEARKRASVIFITGGLGPTKDDITKKTLCKYFKSRLVFNNDVYKDIEKLFAERGYEVTPLNKSQAEIPDVCEAIRNPVGTAPGMWFEQNGLIIISMPGVPFEMMKMMEDRVIPKLLKYFETPFIIHHTLLTQGIAESNLAEKLNLWEEQLPPNFKLAYLPSISAVRLRLTASSVYKEQLQSEFETQLTSLRKIVERYTYGENTDTLESVIGQLLTKKGCTLATAESCTGGSIAAAITKVPGSSKYYKGTIVAYANKAKINILGVSNDDLTNFGAVSQQVVESMALGVLKKLNVDFALATSGIAGPDGGTDEKPIGTVWIAVANKNEVISKKFMLGKDRERTITAATLTALNLLRKFILNKKVTDL